MFAGLIYCVSGHQPLAMQGKTRKGHVYHACGYSNSYGDTAATEIHAGQKWVSLREDTLLPLVEQFFKEHIWGPLRLEKLTSLSSSRSGRGLLARSLSLWAFATNRAAGPATFAWSDRLSVGSSAAMVIVLWSTSAASSPTARRTARLP